MRGIRLICDEGVQGRSIHYVQFQHPVTFQVDLPALSASESRTLCQPIADCKPTGIRAATGAVEMLPSLYMVGSWHLGASSVLSMKRQVY